MASARRRQNSSVSGSSSFASSRTLPHHIRQKSRIPLEPTSAHVSDPFLQKFLSPGFSAADYLNSTLPPLQTSSSSSSSSSTSRNGSDPSSSSTPVPLAELSTQTQAQLSQLNAHTTRLTNTLTQLTDDILRSGSRLAYEVELLRGETLGLSEALAETLYDDLVQFVPGGLREQVNTETTRVARSHTLSVSAPTTPFPASTPITEDYPSLPVAPPLQLAAAAAAAVTNVAENPIFINQLQTLTLVRSRLDAVVKTFGDAMEFVFPPSELSVSSSFLSVSAPEPGSEDRSTEEKGQKVLRQLRDEISDLLLNSSSSGSGSGSGGDPVDGIEKAARRIEELKDLAAVWKGTAEEKGRTKFIDSLARMVEDRHKELMRQMEQQQGARRDGGGATDGGESSGHRRSAQGSIDATAAENRGLSGYGIMSQLQRLRTGL